MSRARIRALGSLLIGILLGLAFAAAWGRLPRPASPDAPRADPAAPR